MKTVERMKHIVKVIRSMLYFPRKIGALFRRQSIMLYLILVMLFLTSYYVVPVFASVAYTLVYKVYVIDCFKIDLENLMFAEVSLRFPSLIMPDNTVVKDVSVEVGLGSSNTPVFTLVSVENHSYDRLQEVSFVEKMNIIHSEDFVYDDLTEFVRQKEDVWFQFRCKVGVYLLLGHVYFNIPYKGTLCLFSKNEEQKVFITKRGVMNQKGRMLVTSAEILPKIPDFLYFSFPQLSIRPYAKIERYGHVTEVLGMGCAIFEPFHKIYIGDTMNCLIVKSQEEIRNIRKVVASLEENDKNLVTIFFHLADLSFFSEKSIKYINAFFKGIEISTTGRDAKKIEDIESEEPILDVLVTNASNSEVRGVLSFHELVFPNAYLYDFVRNVIHGNICVLFSLDGFTIAKLYFSRSMPQREGYVSYEFYGVIFDLSLLACRVISPERSLLHVKVDRSYSLVSSLLDLKEIFFNFRNCLKLTSLGNYTPLGESANCSTHSLINVSSRVVKNGLSGLKILSTIHTAHHEVRTFARLSVSEAFFMIDTHLFRVYVSAKDSNVVFNIGGGGGVINIKDPIEMEVLIEKGQDLSLEDHSCTTAEHSVYKLLLSLFGSSKNGGVDGILRRYARSITIPSPDDCVFIKRTSLKIQEILQYNKFSILYSIQGALVENPVLNLEILFPDIEINVFPVKNEKIIKSGFVKIELQGFKLKIRASPQKVSLEESVTSIPAKISVRFSEDMASGRFTCMYNREQDFISSLVNAYLNFFQFSLGSFNNVEHMRRKHSEVENFSDTPLEILSKFSLCLDEDPIIRGTLSFLAPNSEESKGTMFSIETKKIKVVVKGVNIRRYGLSQRDHVEKHEIFCVEISPIGINMKQEGNASFCQKDILISFQANVLVKSFQEYEFLIECKGGGEENAINPPGDDISDSHTGSFSLKESQIARIMKFLQEFYGLKQDGDKSSSLCTGVELQPETRTEAFLNLFRMLFKKKEGDLTARNDKTAMENKEIVFMKRNFSGNTDHDFFSVKQVFSLKNSSSLTNISKYIGSVLKRINLREYPRNFRLVSEIKIFEKGQKEHSQNLIIKVADSEIAYRPDNRLKEEIFDIECECSGKNELKIHVPDISSLEVIFRKLFPKKHGGGVLFSFNHKKNMYFATLKKIISTDMKINIAIYSNEKLSFGFNTELLTFQDRYTILPLFIVPIEFVNKSLDLRIRTCIDGCLFNVFNVKADVNFGIFQSAIYLLLRNKLLSLEKHVFVENKSFVANEEEFISRFSETCHLDHQDTCKSQ